MAGFGEMLRNIQAVGKKACFLRKNVCIHFVFWCCLDRSEPVFTCLHCLLLFQGVGKGSFWCIDPESRPTLLQGMRKNQVLMAKIDANSPSTLFTTPPPSPGNR